MATYVSSISQALAGSASNVAIPAPFGADAGNNHHGAFSSSSASSSSSNNSNSKNKPGPNMGTGNLLTPPNSISPNLAPHSLKAKAYHDRDQLAHSPPPQLDSDIDLQDAVDHANHHGGSVDKKYGSTPDGSTPDYLHEASVTPLMLARHHLPGIILDKGPIAIRHIMNQLSQTVAGFAEIPPAKGRRIVVAALEAKEGGGVNGEVEFEKVGWGRWDAHVKGRQPREGRGMYAIQEGHPSPLLSAVSSSSSYTPTASLRIPGAAANSRRYKSRRMSHGSWTAESTNSEWMVADVHEDEADKMSIDGDEEAHERYPSARVSMLNPVHRNSNSDTDEEDWEAMGFDALRANSLSRSGGRNFSFSLSRRSRSRSRVRSLAASVPFEARQPMMSAASSHLYQQPTPLDFTGVDANAQERDAIQALMIMGAR